MTRQLRLGRCGANQADLHDTSRRRPRGGRLPRRYAGPALETVKARVTIAMGLRALGVDIGSGGRTRCPLHGGQNRSSFKYDDERYICFACQAHGDIFNLVMGVLGVGFADALAWVQEVTGAPSPGHRKRYPARGHQHLRLRREKALRQWWSECRLQYDCEALRLEDDIAVVDRALESATARGDIEAADGLFNLLARLHADRDDAAWIFTLLDTEDLSMWARLWRAEREENAKWTSRAR